MAQSQVALYNLALALIGDRYTVVSAGEQSIPAETCTLFYEPVRQTILRAAHWNSARRFSRLTEETERDLTAAWVSTDPNPGWAFSYDLPTSILAARYITTFDQFDIGYDNDGKVLNCNVGGDDTEDKPILCYTVDVTDATLWEPDLYLALAHALAAYIFLPLTGKSGRSQMLLEFANGKILDARAAAANERQQSFRQNPEILQARGYSDAGLAPYIYPYGPMFSATGAPLT